MKFVKYESEFIKDILASHSTQSYPFTFIGLKVFGGFYINDCGWTERSGAGGD